MLSPSVNRTPHSTGPASQLTRQKGLYPRVLASIGDHSEHSSPVSKCVWRNSYRVLAASGARNPQRSEGGPEVAKIPVIQLAIVHSNARLVPTDTSSAPTTHHSDVILADLPDSFVGFGEEDTDFVVANMSPYLDQVLASKLAVFRHFHLHGDRR